MPPKKINTKASRQPGIIMANDLRSGLTVYLTAEGEWSEHVSDALVVADESAVNDALRVAAAAEVDNRVTGAYLTDSDDRGEPTVLREILRVQGPSIDYLPAQKPSVHILCAPLQSASIEGISIPATGEM